MARGLSGGHDPVPARPVVEYPGNLGPPRSDDRRGDSRPDHAGNRRRELLAGVFREAGGPPGDGRPCRRKGPGADRRRRVHHGAGLQVRGRCPADRASWDSWCCRRWSTSPTRARRWFIIGPLPESTDLPIMVYNNPVSYCVDITPEMFADLGDEPRLVAIKESSENVRRITDLKNALRRSLYPVLRGGRPGAREPPAGRHAAGSRDWSTPSRPRTGCCGTWPWQGAGRRPARSIDGTRRSFTWIRTSSSSSTSSSPSRSAGSAPRRSGHPGCR